MDEGWLRVMVEGLQAQETGCFEWGASGCQAVGFAGVCPGEGDGCKARL